MHTFQTAAAYLAIRQTECILYVKHLLPFADDFTAERSLFFFFGQ